MAATIAKRYTSRGTRRGRPHCRTSGARYRTNWARLNRGYTVCSYNTEFNLQQPKALINNQAITSLNTLKEISEEEIRNYKAILEKGMIDLDVDLIPDPTWLPSPMRYGSKYYNHPEFIADETFGTDFNAHRQHTATYPHLVTDMSCGTVVEAFIALRTNKTKRSTTIRSEPISMLTIQGKIQHCIHTLWQTSHVVLLLRLSQLYQSFIKHVRIQQLDNRLASTKPKATPMRSVS